MSPATSPTSYARSLHLHLTSFSPWFQMSLRQFGYTRRIDSVSRWRSLSTHVTTTFYLPMWSTPQSSTSRGSDAYLIYHQLSSLLGAKCSAKKIPPCIQLNLLSCYCLHLPLTMRSVYRRTNIQLFLLTPSPKRLFHSIQVYHFSTTPEEGSIKHIMYHSKAP